jgi:hypothetical protein
MGLLVIVFVYLCLQLFKSMGVHHINMDHSIGGVSQGVFEGQVISLWEVSFMNMGPL